MQKKISTLFSMNKDLPRFIWCAACGLLACTNSISVHANETIGQASVQSVPSAEQKRTALSAVEKGETQPAGNAQALPGMNTGENLPLASPDCREIPEILNSGVQQNDVESIYKLGQLYRHGICVRQDTFKASGYFSQAAGRRHKPAIYQLALMQFSGTGGQQDKPAAIEQFRTLANDGFAPAQYTLGYLTLKGDGVPQNPAEAKDWFEKAAGQNDIRAIASLAWLYLEGIGTGRDDAKAVALLPEPPT